MAWVKTEVVEVKPLADYTSKETLWVSAYPDSLNRWTKDLAEGGYSLVSEYEIDPAWTLYRFELDEGKREKLVSKTSPHFQNVVIERSKIS